MSEIENKEILLQLNHLMAENESLKGQLEEYKFVLDTRDRQAEAQRSKIAAASQLQSSFDNQLEELQYLQNYIGNLQQQAEGAFEREMDLEQQVSSSISIEHQLADLKQKYTYLQAQLTDLQTQIQELSNRNLLLQQQAGHIAELESLLENAIRERDEWIEKASEAEQNKQ